MALTGMTGRSRRVAGARSTRSQGRWKAASSYSCSLQRARACQGQMTASEPHGVLLNDPNTSWEGRRDEHVGQWLRRDTARGQPRAASAGAGVSVRCGYESRSYSSERPRPRATHARACRPPRNIRSLPPPEAYAPGPPSGSPLSSPARPVRPHATATKAHQAPSASCRAWHDAHGSWNPLWSYTPWQACAATDPGTHLLRPTEWAEATPSRHALAHTTLRHATT
jgi:hypothetical protein